MPFLTPQGAGYAFTIGYDGKIAEERDTLTCVRCQRVIHRRAGQRFEDIATLDPNSMKVMCIRHADEDDRRTFIQRIEPEEDRDAQLNVLRRLAL